MATLPHLLFLTLSLLSTTTTTTTTTLATKDKFNPFTPKSYLIRYYHLKVSHHHPLPSFLLSKLSPLSAVDSATFSSLPLSSLPSSLCSSPSLLLCPSLSSPQTSNSSDFTSYSSSSNFSNYGSSSISGHDSFSSYSPNTNLPDDSFRRYSHSSSSRPDLFQSYSDDANIATSSFSSYASSSSSGNGSFTSYANEANIPSLTFSSYDSNSIARPRDFQSYSPNTNAGDESFSSYSHHADASPNQFTSYADASNVVGSTFTAYSEDANSGNDTFTSYASDGNGPSNIFHSYGDAANANSATFAAYRERANTGDDAFQSYAKHGNAGKARFDNYGDTYNGGSDSFKGYGQDGAVQPDVDFRRYFGDNTTFKAYAETGIEFSLYRNSSASPSPPKPPGVNRWVEPGKFFRESSLQEGTVMPMPDIRDKLPKRFFLPRSIARRLPFSAAEISRIFGMTEGSAMAKAVAETVSDCERAPSKGETKRCATSAEDMIDFAVSVLGNDAVVRSTAGVGGAGESVVVGKVRGVNGGKVTKSVSCHQSLFPYLVYYCHSVPKVRVYEAEILDAGTKEKANHGVAICHLDTSDWSATHGAFVALGHKPGEIEVCHWIFEGDMTWAVADD